MKQANRRACFLLAWLSAHVFAAGRTIGSHTKPGGVRVRFILLLSLAGLALLAGAGSALAQPQLPSTIYGSASVDGSSVPDGTQVRGLIDGNDCTQPSGTGTVTDGGASAYVISVMHETQRAGCGKEGKTVTFTINGRIAPQTADWKVGIQQVNLNIGQGQPVALPTFTPGPTGGTASVPTPAASGPTAPQPSGPLPTDDVHFSTPKAPGTQPARQDDSGAPVAAILLGALAGIALAGGIAGYLFSRRKPPGPDDSA